MKLKLTSKSKEETISLAKKLAKFLCAKDIVCLTGDLGAGKTTFVSGIASYLGIKEQVTSPTFNILKCYFEGKIPLYHIDAYRLDEHNKDIGLEEYIEGDGIAVIEWPIYIKELLNIPYLEIKIKNTGNDNRELTFISNNEHYEKVIKELKNDYFTS